MVKLRVTIEIDSEQSDSPGVTCTSCSGQMDTEPHSGDLGMHIGIALRGVQGSIAGGMKLEQIIADIKETFDENDGNT